MSATPVTIGLSAVAMAPRGGEAAVLTVRPEPEGLAGLPAGPFDAEAHRTFELALRDFVDHYGTDVVKFWGGRN